MKENEMEDFLKITEKWQKQDDLLFVRGNKTEGMFFYDTVIKAPIWEIDFSFVGKDGNQYSDYDSYELFFRNGKMLICFPEKEKVYSLSHKKFCGIRKMRLYIRTLRESMLVYINEEEGFSPIVEYNLDCPYYKVSQKRDEWVSNLYLALVHGKVNTRKREQEVVDDE